jgi:pimeloyl-ACP methyl ester carboxylesterase
MSITLHANGVRFRVNQHGDGDRSALLLHGFPDDAGSMYPLMDRLAQQGFTCYAPFMRGYGESQVEPGTEFYVADLAEDVVAICEQLDLEDVLLVGHDWGAIATYAACNLEPGRFSHAVAMSVPPATVLLRNALVHPAQLRRSWYMFYFQFPGIPEMRLEADNFACIERLWRDWSPTWEIPRARLAEVKLTFRQGDTVQNALSYYRCLMREAVSNPARYHESWRLVSQRSSVPTLMLAGADDGCISSEMFADPGVAFDGDWLLEVIDGAGHFLPLEAPDRVAEAIRDWVG